MARRKVYIVKSGTLHPTTREYWLTPTYFTSKKVALAEADQILDINKAEDIHSWDRMVEIDPNMIMNVDYVGEGGKYKARLIVEWAWLNSY